MMGATLLLLLLQFPMQRQHEPLVKGKNPSRFVQAIEFNFFNLKFQIRKTILKTMFFNYN